MKNNLKAIAAIVIPIYKENIGKEEVVSLKQCIKIFSAYSICFVCPETLNVGMYEEICSGHQNFSFYKFADYFFKDLAGYNKLLTSVEFYKRFNQFQFILLYQLDCYVFKDELPYWCAQGYDYIGAPWINQKIYHWFYYQNYPAELIWIHRILLKGIFLSKVGNGGLSLRKVSSMIESIERFKKTAINWKPYEDSFFSHYVNTFNPFFKIPSEKIALKFSFDIHPEQCYLMNNQQLPFGCHAWYRDDATYTDNYSFWHKFIHLGKPLSGQ